MTVMVDKVTKKQTIVEQREISVETTLIQPQEPTYQIQPVEFNQQVSTNPNLQTIVQTITQSNPSLVGITPVNTIVQELPQNDKVTMVYDVKGQKERVVVLYNKQTKE